MASASEIDARGLGSPGAPGALGTSRREALGVAGSREVPRGRVPASSPAPCSGPLGCAPKPAPRPRAPAAGGRTSGTMRLGPRAEPALPAGCESEREKVWAAG
eukprot:6807596-Lingulodinium_polyedra.AAC.1